jgi:uncharacterized membrane protein YfcA
MEQIAICAAAFLGGIVSGFAGFAFSAVAGAILLHVLAPILAIPLMMSCTIVSQAATLAVFRRFVDWREALPMIVGGVVGLPIGLGLLVLAQPTAYRIAFGLFLVSYAIYMLVRKPTSSFADMAGPRSHSAVGFVGGLVGGFTAMPGALPMIWCELRGVAREQQRGIVQPFILGMQVLAVTILAMRPGVIRSELLRYTLLALPALAVGVILGLFLFSRIDNARFRAATVWLLVVSGLAMMF